MTDTGLKPGLDMEALDRPFTGWEVPAEFVTFNIVQRFDERVYRFGVAHVYDDGINRIVVTPGNDGLYTASGYFIRIETMAGTPGRWCSNVHEALSEARRMVAEVTK